MTNLFKNWYDKLVSELISMLNYSGNAENTSLWTLKSFKDRSKKEFVFHHFHWFFNFFFRRIHRREDHSWMVTNSSNLIDCEHESVEENPKMLAFFDSLVQRDLRYYPFIRYHVLRPFYPWCHPILHDDDDFWPPIPPNVRFFGVKSDLPHPPLKSDIIKVHIFWEGHKFCEIFPLTVWTLMDAPLVPTKSKHKYITCVQHYKPQLLYFLPHFLKSISLFLKSFI